MKLFALTLPNEQAVLINPDNIVSIRDATASETNLGLTSGSRSKITTVSDFHFVRETIAEIYIKLGELQ